MGHLAWILGLAGCGRAIEGVAFEPGASSGTGTVTFSTEIEGTARVQARLEDGSLLGESPAVPASEGRVVVLGLPSGKDVELVVVVDGQRGEFASEPLALRIDPPVSTVPALRLETWAPERACDAGGYVLFNYFGNGFSGVAVLDREARYVFSLDRPDPEQIARVRPGRDGRSLLYTYAHARKLDDIAAIVRTDLLGNELSVTRTVGAHHDFVELPDERLAWLAYDLRDGADTTPPPANDVGLRDGDCVAGEAIRLADEGSTGTYDELWSQWRAEDFPDPLYVPPEIQFLPGCRETAHANSLGYVASQEVLHVGWRWLDTIYGIRDTGGPPAWQLGGPDTVLPTLAGDPGDLFEHGHFSEVWDGGMLVFDNRNSEIGSRLVEYAIDASSYALVWEHPLDGYEDLLGDVRTIPVEGCDNLLVVRSKQAVIEEITREGETVWRVGPSEGFLGGVVGRAFFLPGDRAPYDLSGLGYPD